MRIPITYSKVERIWDNATVYLVGGGPSLLGFDWSQLNDKHCIAINRAYEVVPNAEVLYWTDHQFYRWHQEGINAFQGLKYTCRPIRVPTQNVNFLRGNNKRGLDERTTHVCHGNNSGYGAINLAIHLGAKRIVLLGYDLHSDENTTHWHDGYPRRHNHSIYDRLMHYFDSVVAPLNSLGIEVINANPKSRLDAFKKMKLEEALNLEGLVPT